MHSKQINVYLTAVDQVELVKQLQATGEFVVVHSLAQGGRFQLLPTTEITEMGAERLQIYLARPADVDAIRLNSMPGHPTMAVDVLRSPVVEFARCYHVGNRMRRGRLYFVTAYFDGCALIRKDNSFLEWASALIATTRRKLKKDAALSTYFGQDALRLKAGGTEFLL